MVVTSMETKLKNLIGELSFNLIVLQDQLEKANLRIKELEGNNG